MNSKNTLSDSPLLTIADVMNVYKVGRKFVNSLIEMGAPCIKKGKRVYFYKPVLDEFIETQMKLRQGFNTQTNTTPIVKDYFS